MTHAPDVAFQARIAMLAKHFFLKSLQDLCPLQVCREVYTYVMTRVLETT